MFNYYSDEFILYIIIDINNYINDILRKYNKNIKIIIPFPKIKII